ncbi:thymidylate synthase [Nitratidesulfovibrio sp.]|uniref:thymidylate synthase n=1 Tax=Nitratidesulfovibrio sp. TaxID=2802297 RepID=UPI003340CFA4
MYIESESISESLVALSRLLISEGFPASPRDIPTLELRGVLIRIKDPRNRIVCVPERRWSASYAVGEFCWHMSADNSLEFIKYYSEAWRAFSDNGVEISGSCYGRHIFSGGNASQWSTVKNLLRSDVNSRRAVLYFADPGYDLESAKDVPCISNMQFMVRNRKIDCFVSMRSNDLILGYCYDVYFMTMLQEMMAVELGLDIGEYTHFVASMHAYCDKLDVVRNVSSSAMSICEPMSPMCCVDEISTVLEVERMLRSGDANGLNLIGNLSEYWKDFCSPLINKFYKKHGCSM